MTISPLTLKARFGNLQAVDTSWQIRMLAEMSDNKADNNDDNRYFRFLWKNARDCYQVGSEKSFYPRNPIAKATLNSKAFRTPRSQTDPSQRCDKLGGCTIDGRGNGLPATSR